VVKSQKWSESKWSESGQLTSLTKVVRKWSIDHFDQSDQKVVRKWSENGQLTTLTKVVKKGQKWSIG
jgi:hypothetical protein